MHFQTTAIVETAAPFHAPYGAYHSMDSHGALQETLSVDFAGGRRLWNGGEIHADFLVWQGYGLSTSFGIENFPDSDAYKAGTKSANVMFSHLFLEHTFEFGGEREDIPDSPLTLAGQKDISRLTLYLGRMTPLDIFDHNRYAGDGHLQFMSWGGTANMTWDYGQDTIGYGTGFMADLNQRTWALRYGFFLMPNYVNAGNVGSGDGGEDQALTIPARGQFGPLTKSWGMSVELEKRYAISGHPGAVRVLAWKDSAKMVDYEVAAQVLSTQGAGTDLTPYEAYHHSYGYGLNIEQEINAGIGVFARLGWNDGKTQALEFTDTNWGVSTGVGLDGSLWNQPKHHGGVAIFLAGASKANQGYLRAGGLGILAGDGFLTYAVEKSFTPYYDMELLPGFHFALQYQLTVDPAFNRDRGPISTLMLRFHYEQ